jgi:RNA polymerase sigma-70 factor (sigma-E family)
VDDAMTGKAVDAAARQGAAPQGAARRAGAPYGAGDAEAVRDLFRDHHLELVRLAAVMLGDVPAAEDVVQDAFERLHRHWRRVRSPSSGLAYVRSCVLNACRSAHRRDAVARKYAPRLAGRPGDIGRDPAAAVADTTQVMAALRLLTRRQREVVVLRYYADQDVAEIAETLRISPGAVRAVMNRALAVLGRALEEE